MKKIMFFLFAIGFFMTLGVCWADGAFIELGAVQKHGKTIVVGPVGTTTENGALLRNALNDISGNTNENPFLLKLEPGIYNIEDTPLEMKEFVHVEGSGEGLTIIVGNINTTDSGVIVAADNMELRFLSIQNLGGASGSNTHSIGIYCNGTSPRITFVTVWAKNGDRHCFAVNALNGAAPLLTNVSLNAIDADEENLGLYVQSANSAPTMRNSKIYVSGGAQNRGVYVESSASAYLDDVEIVAQGPSSHGVLFKTDGEVDVRNCLIDAQYAVLVTSNAGTGGTLKIDSSIIIGSINGVRNDNGANTGFFVGASRIEGSNTASDITCVGAYDGSYAPLDEDCQSIP